jgi:crossover junction endodeoxyribonuclease RuvC
MPAGGLILGIDPGLASTGYGVVDAERLVACGSVRTAPGSPGARLVSLVGQLQLVLSRYAIAEAAMEELFMGRNRTSVIGVAQARGAILACLESAGVRTFEYKPSQVKAVLTGYGSADKTQVARMVALQLGLAAKPGDDHASDALAIAVCHARSRRLNAAAAR